MELTTSEIIEVIHTLPTFEREKIRKTLEEDKKQRLKNQLERYKKARKWLDEHGAEYMNQWVCLEGDRLIGNSIDGKGLYQLAKDAGIETPFMHHIDEEPKFVLGEGYELARD
jgi:hypothetical protein